MYLETNFESIILNRKQFDLKDYELLIKEATEDLAVNISLIVKYDTNKVITAKKNLYVNKTDSLKPIYPLTYFGHLFLYNGSHGYPVEYELIVKSNKTKYKKYKIEFKEE